MARPAIRAIVGGVVGAAVLNAVGLEAILGAPAALFAWLAQLTLAEVTAAAAVIVLVLLFYQPLVIVHEHTHRVALARYGLRGRIRYDRPSVRGRQLPILTGGSCSLRGLVLPGRLTFRQNAVAALAPLAITVATAPITLGLFWSLVPDWSWRDLAVVIGFHLGGTGPSLSDYLHVLTWDRELMNAVQAAVQNHGSAEGALNTGPNRPEGSHAVAREQYHGGDR